MTRALLSRLLIIVVVSLLAQAGLAQAGQARGGAARTPLHASEVQADRAKVHDREWLKSQVRRRYGTAAIPSKTTPKPSSDPNEKPAPKKDPAKSSSD
jgi:hypothetical protein